MNTLTDVTFTPKTSLTKIQDIEDYCKEKPGSYIFREYTMTEDEYEKFKVLVNDLKDLIDLNIEKIDEKPETFEELIRKMWRKHKVMPTKPRIMDVYFRMLDEKSIEKSKNFERCLVSHHTRGLSGVSVVAVFLSPYPNGQKFSCRWNCHYCPNEPGQPRSYLFGEPGVLRANQYAFDCVKQIYNRVRALTLCGHPPDKFEVLILGGTIHSYPEKYLEEFIRDIFYAANTCLDHDSRLRGTLLEEQNINEASEHRIIGITIETRPDCINAKELQKFRRWGVTRIQMGIQHTVDEILKKSNRGHGLKHIMRACQLLRDSCFKFDVHIMPNLPGSTPEIDIEMLNYVLTYIHPDQVKMYPTTVTPFTKILEDYKEGKYVPYDNKDLEKVIMYWMTHVNPWVRNNRIVRDIPHYYIVDGVESSNQKQDFDEVMKQNGLKCKCIRYREAGRQVENPADGELVIREYDAHEGKEYFISWESKPEGGEEEDYRVLGYNEKRKAIFGFVRLRITKNQCIDIFPELEGCALIRELHVYGKTMEVNKKNERDGEFVQHIGIGKTLMTKAEEIAKGYGYSKMCVIAGIGTRGYYKKIGYNQVETFMIKNI